MKAIEQFKMEAVEQFGAGSVISEESAKQILKTIGRSGFGLGHLKQSGMSLKSGEYQLPVDFQESKVAKISKPKPKKVEENAVRIPINIVFQTTPQLYALYKQSIPQMPLLINLFTYLLIIGTYCLIIFVLIPVSLRSSFA